MKKNKKKVETKNDSVYDVIFQANDTEYTSSNENLFEALSNIPLHFMELKTKANVIVSKGDRKVERLLHLRQGRMLLHNHLRRKGFVNAFEDLLNKV